MQIRSNFLNAGAACALATALCGLSLGGSAIAKTSYVTFDGSATSLNVDDTVAGYVQVSDDIQGFLRTSDGTITTFVVDGSDFTAPFSINDTGEIAGSYSNESTGDLEGFVRASDGTVTTFTGPDAGYTNALNINNKNDVTGNYSQNGSNIQHGFLRKAGGGIVSFDAPGSDGTYPQCITDKSVIIGFYSENGTYQGFVRAQDGTFTTIDVPGAQDTYAVCSNVRGTVAGYYDIAGGGGGGFILTPDGTITTFGEQDCQAQIPTPLYVMGINRKGTITGACYNRTHPHTTGYVRRPDGSIRKFHVPQQGPKTIPAAINNAGMIVGVDANGSFLRFP